MSDFPGILLYQSGKFFTYFFLTDVYTLYILFLKGLVISMVASVQKWGNSLGIRIPRIILDAASISENDKVELEQNGETITIRKLAPTVHRSLEERLVAFYGKPIEAIASVESSAEYDWGSPKGNEIW